MLNIIIIIIAVIKARRVHHAKKEGRHCINTFTTHRLENVEEFFRVLEDLYPAQHIHMQLRDGNTSEIPSTMLFH